MRVLVTGGTGVAGKGAVNELLRRGHSVRLLSRHAERDAVQWQGEAVEPFPADLSDIATLDGCADGCETVLHIAGIVAESPPELTFQRINVEGTRRIVEVASRAGARRFVFLSSLGSDRGASAYHRSKLRAEEEVRSFEGDWIIARPGSVYGPGDAVISVLLKMIRSLPGIPIVDDGNQPFQPIWHDDLGRALATIIERRDIGGRAMELAGLEITSMNDLIDRLSAITGLDPGRVPVPAPLASAAVRFASAAGIDAPVKEAQIQMLVEKNVIEPPAQNALPGLLDHAPTPLDVGLRTLADSLPEQLPSTGVADPVRKRFYARIEGSALEPVELCARFRSRWADVVPLNTAVESGEPATVREGDTLTMALPARGTVQVRCEEVTDRSLTFATLEGHPLAGIIHFTFSRDGRALVFEILIYARAADALDLLMVRTTGDDMQDSTWRRTILRVVELSGGSAPGGVVQESEAVGADRAADLDRRIEELILARRRREGG